MYHIVKFLDSSEVEVVPSSWVQNETCFWPPYKLIKFHKAVTTQECPAPTWKTFRVRVLHTTETYRAAQQKLPQATLMSDLKTEDDDDDDLPSCAKRKDRGGKRHGSSESEDVLLWKRLDKRGRLEALVPCRNQFSPSASKVGDEDGVCERLLSVMTEVLKEQKLMNQQLSTFLRNQQTQNRGSSHREELQDQVTSVPPLSSLSNLPKRPGSGW